MLKPQVEDEMIHSVGRDRRYLLDDFLGLASDDDPKKVLDGLEATGWLHPGTARLR